MTRKEILATHRAKIAQHADGRWRTYVVTAEGKKRQLVRTTLKKLEDDIVQNYKEVHGTPDKSPTFKACYYHWRELHDLKVTDNTKSKYDSDFVRYFEGESFSERPIADITGEDVEKFVFKKIMELSLCREATKSLLDYIKGTFRSAKNNRVIREDVTADIKRSEFFCKCVETPHNPDAVLVSDRDWKALYKRLEMDFQDNPVYMPPYAILMAAFTGMRVSELAALQWNDIKQDPITGRFYFLISRSEKYNVQTKEYHIGEVKNKRPRIYPVTPQINDLLTKIKSVRQQNQINDQWIFSNGDGRNIHKRNISDCLKNRCKQIGITPKGIHAFRRQINSDMRCDGVSSVITSSLIGNTQAVNQKHYTYDVIGLEEKERIVEQTNRKRLAAGGC
ncbi:MAG: tyrosine-type recombinase/integrase [Lachnospiraceae bacterium]|nr:tyrosine-type recombinase/integrase [Lachnospiraceae bacterium]